MHKLHVMATLKLTHAALGKMVARDRGAVVNVSSVAAFIRSARSASYCATKTWMAVFTEALYLELRSVGSNVAVQALCPGFTYSEFHDVAGLDRRGLAPAAFWQSAEEVVEASLDGLRRGKDVRHSGLALPFSDFAADEASHAMASCRRGWRVKGAGQGSGGVTAGKATDSDLPANRC